MCSLESSLWGAAEGHGAAQSLYHHPKRIASSACTDYNARRFADVVLMTTLTIRNVELAEAICRRFLPLGGADELEPHPPVPVGAPPALDR